MKKRVKDKRKRRIVFFTILISLLFVSMAYLSIRSLRRVKAYEKDYTMRLVVPENWELLVGDSRTVDAVIGYSINDRVLKWSASPSDVASVDKWGRVTALKEGVATIKCATLDDKYESTCTLNVVSTPTKYLNEIRKVDYQGTPKIFNDTLQKIVTRFKKDEINGSEEIPENIKAIFNNTDKSAYKEATTLDGAKWTITDYGVKRVLDNASNSRDVEQHFMGERYFIDVDTTDYKVLGIEEDSLNGIWTFMANGITHIEMVEMSDEEIYDYIKDEMMRNVYRHGYQSIAIKLNGNDEWLPWEDDNDGLWTSMYAVGELMRYQILKEEGAPLNEIAEARSSALDATEAVLLLSNISMRTGTVEAKVRYQPNGEFDYNYKDFSLAKRGSLFSNKVDGKFLSDEALILGGNYSIKVPSISPSDMYDEVYADYEKSGVLKGYIFDRDHLYPVDYRSWKNPNIDTEYEYETRTRLLEGYIARTYSYKDEMNKHTDFPGYIHWGINSDGTQTGYKTTYWTKERGWYYMNGEYLNGHVLDSSNVNKPIPERLWTDMIAHTGHSVSDIMYKADTSQDELIGHFFMYKLAYDVFKDEDPELTNILIDTVDNICQHITDNGYMMVDGNGQPNTWIKFNREFFLHSQQMGGSPLSAAICLSMFKTASYITGYQKWENEYRMCALDESYEYAKLLPQYNIQTKLYMVNYLSKVGLGWLVKLMNEDTISILTRMFLNYSDEELAMLAYYNLFQLETDEELLSIYRDGIDNWWKSISYEENPLWYYIYQLAYPDKQIKDAYDNNILDTASWTLSRHPMLHIRYCTSNRNRDDIGVFDLDYYIFGIDTDISPVTVDLRKTDSKLAKKVKEGKSPFDLIHVIVNADKLEYGIMAPDERNIFKYGHTPYFANSNYRDDRHDGCETYSLPYWLGRYHNMLEPKGE